MSEEDDILQQLLGICGVTDADDAEVTDETIERLASAAKERVQQLQDRLEQLAAEKQEVLHCLYCTIFLLMISHGGVDSGSDMVRVQAIASWHPPFQSQDSFLKFTFPLRNIFLMWVGGSVGSVRLLRVPNDPRPPFGVPRWMNCCSWAWGQDQAAYLKT